MTFQKRKRRNELFKTKLIGQIKYSLGKFPLIIIHEKNLHGYSDEMK